MPTYQYRCTACGDELEAVQKFTDPALTDCPCCAGDLRKVFSAVGVVFKGSGFYATDSRKADPRKTASSASNSAGKDKAGSTSPSSTPSDTSKATSPSKASTSA